MSKRLLDLLLAARTNTSTADLRSARTPQLPMMTRAQRTAFAWTHA